MEEEDATAPETCPDGAGWRRVRKKESMAGCLPSAIAPPEWETDAPHQLKLEPIIHFPQVHLRKPCYNFHYVRSMSLGQKDYNCSPAEVSCQLDVPETPLKEVAQEDPDQILNHLS